MIVGGKACVRDEVELRNIEKMEREYLELLGRVVGYPGRLRDWKSSHLYVRDILPYAHTRLNS